jgi:hypothetical protein
LFLYFRALSFLRERLKKKKIEKNRDEAKKEMLKIQLKQKYLKIWKKLVKIKMGIRLLDAKRRQRILEICLKGFEDYANLKENKRAVYSQAYGIRENHLLHSTFNKWKQAIPLFIQQRQHSQLKLKYFNLWIKAFILKQVHLYSFTFHFLQYFFLVLFIPFLIII